MKHTHWFLGAAGVACISFIATSSIVRADTLNAPAFTLTRVTTESPGLATAGLVDRGRCEITDSQLAIVKIVDGTPLMRTIPITFTDPLIPEAVNTIPALAATVGGAALPEFPAGTPTTNYWISTPSDGTGRRLLESVQNGTVVAQDVSTPARTLVRILDANCI